jgi:hypothetical protein
MRDSKYEDALALYAIEKQEEEARHDNSPEAGANTTAARRKLDKAKRRTLHEVDEIDPEVPGFPLEVLRGTDQLRLSFGGETRGSSTDGGARFAKNLIGRDPTNLARKKVIESTLGLLQPKPLAIGIRVIVETRDEPLRKASSCFRRQLQNLGLKSTNRVSHRICPTTASAMVPRASPWNSALANDRALSGRPRVQPGRDKPFGGRSNRGLGGRPVNIISENQS